MHSDRHLYKWVSGCGLCEPFTKKKFADGTVLPRARHTREYHGQLERAEEDDEERTTGRCCLGLDIPGSITGSWSKLKKMKSVRRDGVASG